MTHELKIEIIAEGGVWETRQLQKVFNEPILSAVVGTAITRPREITKRFVQAILEGRQAEEQRKMHEAY